MRGIIAVIILTAVTNLSFGQSFGKRFQTESNKEATLTKERIENVQLEHELIVLEKAISPREYIVGPGDVIGINIILTDNINIELHVSPTGEILIPSIGKIYLNGLVLEEAIKLITNQINKVYPSASVNIVLINIRNYQIQIAGAVNKPGFYQVTPVTRLHEILDKAEGFQQFAREFQIEIIRRDGKKELINYFNYQLDGKLDCDPTFKEGDIIFIPFGEPESESIVLRGAISGSGYDIIEENELLGHYLRRKARFVENADLDDVTITRSDADTQVVFTVYPKDFFSTNLKAGDAIDILTERGISVNGFVSEPGSFYYYPGYSSLDYINMAGGNTAEGDVEKSIVRHLDGRIESGKTASLRRGDVIIVPRTSKSIIFGDLSILEIITSVSTVLLTFIAAIK